MTGKAEERKCFAVVKVRGTISAQREARETLDMLRLARTNNAVLVDNRPSYMGMLYRVQNYVTWGEASKETVALLLKERGRLAGGKKLTDETAEKLGYKSISCRTCSPYSSCIPQAKASKEKPKRASAQAARQATAAKKSANS